MKWIVPLFIAIATSCPIHTFAVVTCDGVDVDTDGAVTVADVYAEFWCIRRHAQADTACDVTGDAFADDWDLEAVWYGIFACSGWPIENVETCGVSDVYHPPYTPESHPFWDIGNGWWMNLSRPKIPPSGDIPSDCPGGPCKVEVNLHHAWWGFPSQTVYAGEIFRVGPDNVWQYPAGIPAVSVRVDSVAVIPSSGGLSVLEVVWCATTNP